MKLKVERIAMKDAYTIGKLYVDGEYFCDTLEDKVRPRGEKVAGSTAIPEGVYQVEMTYSPLFGRQMPMIFDVPNFTGVRIHAGNSAEDTKGCILVGLNKAPGRVLDSRKICDELNKKIQVGTAMGKKCAIEILGHK